MTDMQCLKIRLNDEMTDEAITWFRDLNGHHTEIFQSRWRLTRARPRGVASAASPCGGGAEGEIRL